MIEKMLEVCVVTKLSDKKEMLTSLRELGIMHISERKSSDSAFIERFSTITKLLEELTAYASESVSDKILTDDEFENLYQKTIAVLSKKEELKSIKNELQIEYEKLQSWGDFDSDEILALKQSVDLHYYRVDKSVYRQLVKDEEVKFISICKIDGMEGIAVIGKLDNKYSAVEFVPPKKGTIKLKQEISECDKELDKCEQLLKEYATHLQSYKEQLVKSQNQIEYSEVDNSVTENDSIIWLGGYIPNDEKDNFEKLAKEKQWAYAIGEVREEDAQVPTKIKYNKVTALIKPIFDLLGVVPGYREYDISIYFLVFFSIFFAMIIGDAGYGVIFLVLAIVLNIKMKKANNLIFLLYLISTTTIIWGAITGTWLGLEGAMKIPFLKALVIKEIANYPEYFGIEAVSQQNTIMKLCFSIGVIQLSLACVMNLRRKIAKGSLAWISDIGWLLSVSALYFMVLNLVISQPVNFGAIVIAVLVGFLLVLVFGGMEKDKTFMQGLKAGLGNVFTVFLDTISAFGNLMSYIRLFAVGMASLAIAQSFNGMAEGFSGALVIVGILIMAVGHLLNIVMGFLSVVVHGVRLNLLEFSGQLGMEWSGVNYNPFKKIK